MTRTTRWPRLPTVMVVVSLVVVAVGVVLMFVGGQQVGATWDERVHAVMLANYFDTGWYGSPDWFVNGEPDTPIGKWPYFVYAPVASLLVHFWAAVTGNEPWADFSDSASAHAARHIGTAVMGLLGVLAVAAITRLITRSWRWAALSAALLCAIPMWVGHAMFNVKDLPVGVGYTLVTLGFVIVLLPGYGARAPRSLRARIAAWVTVVAGILLSVGTRPASGLPMALTAGGLVLVCLIGRWRAGPGTSRRRSAAVRAVDVVGSFALAYVALVAVYPKGFLNPFRLVKETLLISGRFPVNDAVLTNGVWLPQPPPWTYLPTWFAAQLPLIVLGATAVFVVAWVVGAVRVVRQGGGDRTLTRWVVLSLPVALQAALFPLLAIAVHSTIYNAVRQFLFVPPALAVLSALGVWLLWNKLVSYGRRWWGYSLLTLVAVGMVVPMVDQIRLFPYGYVYFNEMATLRPINGNWATDYWRASGPEIVARIPATGDVGCIFVDARHPFRDCSVDATLAPYWRVRGAEAKPALLADGEYWLVRENGGDVTPPPGCTLVDEVTRPLRGQTVVIAQVLRCQYPDTAAG